MIMLVSMGYFLHSETARSTLYSDQVHHVSEERQVDESAGFLYDE